MGVCYEAFAWGFIFIQSIHMQAKLYVTFRLFLFKRWLTSTQSPVHAIWISLLILFLFTTTFTLHSWPRWIFVFLCTSTSREYLLHYLSPRHVVAFFLSRHLSSLLLILYIFASTHLMCSADSGGGRSEKQVRECDWERKNDWRREDAHHIPFSLQLPMAE